jgi:hypothetical protein
MPDLSFNVQISGSSHQTSASGGSLVDPKYVKEPRSPGGEEDRGGSQEKGVPLIIHLKFKLYLKSCLEDLVRVKFVETGFRTIL